MSRARWQIAVGSAPGQHDVAASGPEILRLSERAIVSTLDSGCGLLGQVARSVGLSERTLQRRLNRCGCGFAELVEAVRLTRAEVLLGDAAMSLVEVALSLGYSDQSAFSRAFKRWTSLTPGVYRQRGIDGRGQPGSASAAHVSIPFRAGPDL